MGKYGIWGGRREKGVFVVPQQINIEKTFQKCKLRQQYLSVI